MPTRRRATRLAESVAASIVGDHRVDPGVAGVVCELRRVGLASRWPRKQSPLETAAITGVQPTPSLLDQLAGSVEGAETRAQDCRYFACRGVIGTLHERPQPLGLPGELD